MQEHGTRQKVASLLQGLGGTHEEVAASLKAAGVRGHRKAPLACPLSSYLVPRVGIRLGVAKPFVFTLMGGGLAAEVLTPCPPAVAEFIALFDAGSYPELEVVQEVPA